MLSFVRLGCRFSAGLGTQWLRLNKSWNLWTPCLLQEPVLDLHGITGQDLFEVSKAKRSTAVGLDGLAWN